MITIFQAPTTSTAATTTTPKTIAVAFVSVLDTQYTQLKASDACKKLGLNLAVIGSASEHTTAQSYLTNLTC